MEFGFLDAAQCLEYLIFSDHAFSLLAVCALGGLALCDGKHR